MIDGKLEVVDGKLASPEQRQKITAFFEKISKHTLILRIQGNGFFGVM